MFVWNKLLFKKHLFLPPSLTCFLASLSRTELLSFCKCWRLIIVNCNAEHLCLFKWEVYFNKSGKKKINLQILQEEESTWIATTESSLC